MGGEAAEWVLGAEGEARLGWCECSFRDLSNMSPSVYCLSSKLEFAFTRSSIVPITSDVRPSASHSSYHRIGKATIAPQLDGS